MLGTPGAVLVRRSSEAQLLALGASRRISRLIRGSVGHYCLSHSRTPIVAIPAFLEPSLTVDGSAGPASNDISVHRPGWFADGECR